MLIEWKSMWFLKNPSIKKRRTYCRLNFTKFLLTRLRLLYKRMHGRQFVDFSTWICREVPFLQANISWWSKRMQPQLLKCVYLHTYSPIDQYYYIAIRSKLGGIWTIIRPLWAFIKKEFFTFFLLPLTVRIYSENRIKKWCSVTSFEF